MDKATYEKGLSIRREVLGAEYVDNAIASADDFSLPIQQLSTQYCWGEVGAGRDWSGRREALSIWR